MSKLRNSYPADIACVLCFPGIFRTTQTNLTLVRRLFAMPVFRVETSGLYSTVGRLHGSVYSGNLRSKTFRVTSGSAFYRRIFSYTDEFNKRGVGEVQ